MKKIKTISAVVLVAVLICLCMGGCEDREATCRKYEALLGGYHYIGYDSTSTVSHGDVSYNYDMELRTDGTCDIHFKAIRTNDNSTFSKNGTFPFDVTGMTWSVRYNEGEYEVYLSGGAWDWQGWSAAEISRSIQILDHEGSDLQLKALRSKYYDFYFREGEPIADSAVKDQPAP